MPSEAMFYPHMRVRDVIRLSADLRHMNCTEEAASLSERLQLDVSKKVGQLSLGNRKKVSIICALQHKPKLCVLDEPTSGLDPLMQHEFYAILKERNAVGATIFLSSHVLSEVQRYCKSAAVIRDGNILVCDSIENLGHTEARRVTIRGSQTSPALDNMKDIKTNGDTISFLYGGKPNTLLNALAAMPLTDVNILEPDLEEIFMHYYAKEEKEHTAEFLLAHPISRRKIVTQKLCSLLLQIVILNAVVIGITALSVVIIEESPDAKALALLFLAYFILQVEMASICFGISAFLNRGGLGIGIDIAAVFYFLNIIANLTEQAKHLKYITPFGYTEGSDIIANKSLNANT